MKCVGTNLIQNTAHSGEATHSLDVHYDPEWIDKPGDVSAGEGKEVKLKCLADGNPTPSYIWSKGVEGGQVITNSSELSVTVTEEKAVYTCRVTVKGSNEISAKATVFRKGPPQILTTETLKTARLGYEGVLECSARGVPLPQRIQWSFDELSLSNTAKYEITQEPGDQLHRSTLRIKNVGPVDFGSYKCTVTNGIGSPTFMSLELKKQDEPLTAQTVMVSSKYFIPPIVISTI